MTYSVKHIHKCAGKKNGKQQDYKLTTLLGPDKEKLPAKNCQDGDYILQPEVKSYVDKCEVKHSN